MRFIKMHEAYPPSIEDQFKQQIKDPERNMIFEAYKNESLKLIWLRRYAPKDLVDDLSSNGTMISIAIATGAAACFNSVVPQDALAVLTIDKANNQFVVCAKSIDGEKIIIPETRRRLNAQSIPNESPCDVTIELRPIITAEKNGETILVISYQNFWEKTKFKLKQLGALKWKK